MVLLWHNVYIMNEMWTTIDQRFWKENRSLRSIRGCQFLTVWIGGLKPIRKGSNKFPAIFLGVLLLLSIAVPAVVLAEDANTLALQMQDTHVNVDQTDTVEVSYSITENAGFCDAKLIWTFNSSVLELVSAVSNNDALTVEKFTGNRLRYCIRSGNGRFGIGLRNCLQCQPSILFQPRCHSGDGQLGYHGVWVWWRAVEHRYPCVGKRRLEIKRQYGWTDQRRKCFGPGRPFLRCGRRLWRHQRFFYQWSWKSGGGRDSSESERCQ